MGDILESAAEPLKFYPSKIWGLDPHFYTANKMYITDIVRMPRHPLAPGVFVYKNHPIYKVDVMGTIVKKSENSKCYMYGVDDGTAVIQCCCWKKSIHPTGTEEEFSSLPKSLLDKFQQLMKHRITAEEGYELGDYIHVKGKVKIFRRMKEVVAYYHELIDDPMIQVQRLFELPLLYAKHYDIPHTPPLQVTEALNLTGDGSKDRTRASIVNELKNFLANHITMDTNITHLLVDDLIRLPGVKDIILLQEHHERGQRTLIEEALKLLVDCGQVVSRKDKNDVYEVLVHKSLMEDMILKILKRDIRKPKCVEKGCHYFHVREELRRTVQYAGVQTSAVLFCLSKLEHQSEVIRSTHAHYIAL